MSLTWHDGYIVQCYIIFYLIFFLAKVDNDKTKGFTCRGALLFAQPWTELLRQRSTTFNFSRLFCSFENVGARGKIEADTSLKRDRTLLYVSWSETRPTSVESIAQASSFSVYILYQKLVSRFAIFPRAGISPVTLSASVSVIDTGKEMTHVSIIVYPWPAELDRERFRFVKITILFLK